MQTITLLDSAGNAKTFPAPTTVDAYPDGVVNPFVPADGAVVVQRSASRGNTGDLGGVRSLAWDALPESAPTGYTFTGTVAILKALEGLNTTLTLGTTWGTLYQTGQTITVLQVMVRERARIDGKTWYSVRLEFVER